MSFDRRADRFADIVDNIDRIDTHIALLEGEPLQQSAVISDAVERCLARIRA